MKFDSNFVKNLAKALGGSRRLAGEAMVSTRSIERWCQGRPPSLPHQKLLMYIKRDFDEGRLQTQPPLKRRRRKLRKGKSDTVSL